ncbi:xanthine dehydrogenase family protein molybdopterin-binding subunit [Anaeroselena agilis]|uniref:Xanthine dehydrogenase family protein molybdopterin-binding subunit n=1 Tax=Anaeroselena agilis TaxID=3063788 RepID=A0ABU3P3K7_9FIRM|nr:xanthine dehydrogenase family protein molybdopterin-binding subunit [Selenomonadales bacterium 4137-cl]
MSRNDWRSSGLPAGVQEVGRPALRADAAAKVTGAERYAADYYPENYLWGGVKRAGIPHARITAVDTAAALALPGVVAVLTYKDIKGKNRLGIFEKDQPILADTVVRHCGDAVALAVAETKESLAAALAAIRVDYEPLPAVFTPEEALAAGAPCVHEGRSAGNLLLESEIIFGDAGEALAACRYTAELTVAVNWQEHAFLETQTGVAWQEADGSLAMVVSTQTPFRDRLELAEALGLPPDRIRVTAPYLGGGFGGKDGVTVQGFLALAALHSGGRPVKIWYSREESILAGTKRHPATAVYRLGCDADGALQALDCRLVFDTGAYASLGTEVFALALEHAGGPYRIANVAVRGAIAYTNNPVGGAFRGFGVPQAAAGMEQAMDELARVAGFDPLDLRRRNAVRRGDTTPTGVAVSRPAGLDECLAQVERHPLWRGRQAWREGAPPFRRRGVGVAAVYHGMGFGPVVTDYANAKLELTAEGRIIVCAGVADMGQGNATTCLQIASHCLGQPYESMELVLPDTARTLPSASSSASRTTFTYGNALVGAAGLLKERILARGALLLSFQLMAPVGAGDVELLPGRVFHAPSGRSIPLKMIAGFMDAAERTTTYSYTCQANTQAIPTGENLRLHGYPHRIFAYGVQLARVETDTLTGETKVCDYLSCVDAGRVLNPQLYEQQLHGGAVQGMGYALFEDFAVAGGRIATGDLATYILPTAADVPDVEVVSVAVSEDDGPFGMKGVGEVVIDGVLPAVANAVADAAGSRVTRGTLTAEKILAALRAGGREAAR